LENKILILLPIWQRERITKICLDNLKDLQKSFNIEVLCVVSEQWAKQEAFKYGFKYVEASNECLGTKMNIGIERAMEMNFDYLMNLGSDDIITKELIESYKDLFYNNVPVFGPTKLTFIDSKAKELKTYNYGIMIGAGRCISKDILKKTLRKGDIYDKIQIGLDMNSMKKFDCSMVEVDNDFNTIYDIKSDVNLWTYDVFTKAKQGEFEEGVSGLSTEQIDAILDL
jgi:hypothetical protein